MIGLSWAYIEAYTFEHVKCFGVLEASRCPNYQSCRRHTQCVMSDFNMQSRKSDKTTEIEENCEMCMHLLDGSLQGGPCRPGRD
jgi:hypothetical protein